VTFGAGVGRGLNTTIARRRLHHHRCRRRGYNASGPGSERQSLGGKEKTEGEEKTRGEEKTEGEERGGGREARRLLAARSTSTKRRSCEGVGAVVGWR
jgi:hypothetical protein